MYHSFCIFYKKYHLMYRFLKSGQSINTIYMPMGKHKYFIDFKFCFRNFLLIKIKFKFFH